jgi:7-carboxy-7-deazaguanine synthase
MFGKNPIEKSEIDGDGLTLRVVNGRAWYTIQGEGPFAGDPAIFLRLHGCPLRCFFCDTEFSHPQDPYVPVDQLVHQIENEGPSWCRLLVVTGGEPVRQNLAPLIEKMVVERGWTVQIETSGILWQECLHDTVVVCSPKTPTVHPQILEHAHAFKYVIQHGETDPEDGLPLTNTQIEHGKPHRLARPRKDAPVYLSPMDECDELKNKLNRDEVLLSTLNYGYRAGLQIHKVLGTP